MPISASGAVPDIDRTQYFLCIGANPYISNGSALTAPNVKAHMRAIRSRGGKIVVIDPRRTETAKEADEWVAIRPGEHEGETVRPPPRGRHAAGAIIGSLWS